MSIYRFHYLDKYGNTVVSSLHSHHDSNISISDIVDKVCFGSSSLDFDCCSRNPVYSGHQWMLDQDRTIQILNG